MNNWTPHCCPCCGADRCRCSKAECFLAIGSERDIWMGVCQGFQRTKPEASFNDALRVHARRLEDAHARTLAMFAGEGADDE